MIALARGGESTGWHKITALWLVLVGIAACLAFLTFEFWDYLLVPPPSEWRDSLPGMGRMILAIELMLSVAGVGLVLGWGILGVTHLRARRTG